MPHRVGTRRTPAPSTTRPKRPPRRGMIRRVPADVSAAIRSQFGEIDIYLFDQLLRGRFDGRRRILDAGSGSGRNLLFFLRQGFDVRAVDADPAAIRALREFAAAVSPAIRPDQIQHASVESLPWGRFVQLSQMALSGDWLGDALAVCWVLGFK